MVLKRYNVIQLWTTVWEWCKNVWYWNTDSYFKDLSSVWEWCKNVWNWNSSADTIRSGMFENDVKMYGTETQIRQLQYPLVFENDVKMYGTKTDK